MFITMPENAPPQLSEMNIASMNARAGIGSMKMTIGRKIASMLDTVIPGTAPSIMPTMQPSGIAMSTPGVKSSCAPCQTVDKSNSIADPALDDQSGRQPDPEQLRCHNPKHQHGDATG